MATRTCVQGRLKVRIKERYICCLQALQGSSCQPLLSDLFAGLPTPWGCTSALGALIGMTSRAMEARHEQRDCTPPGSYPDQRGDAVVRRGQRPERTTRDRLPMEQRQGPAACQHREATPRTAGHSEFPRAALAQMSASGGGCLSARRACSPASPCAWIDTDRISGSLSWGDNPGQPDRQPSASPTQPKTSWLY